MRLSLDHLTITPHAPLPRSAGVLSVHVNTVVPGMARSHQDGGCRVGEARLLHPLYYVVHTHRLGEVGQCAQCAQSPGDGAPAAGHGVAGQEGRGGRGPVAAAGPQVAPGTPVPLQGRGGHTADQGGQAGGELRRYLDISRYIYTRCPHR